MFKADHGVIVACDVRTLEELETLVRGTSSVSGVVGYKLGFILGLNYGLKNAVDAVREISDLPVIYDHQKAGTDIPEMGSAFAETMRRAGVNSAIIFPQAGPKTQEAFVNALLQHGVVPMVGGDMTHDGYLQKNGGYISDNSPERMYENGAKAGAEFFVAPGNKPGALQKYAAMLSQITKPKFCLIGIGRQGGTITSAFTACSVHPAYAVVGSSIYSAPDMTAAAKGFGEEAMRFE